ncbi:hypothetical protein FRB94_012833 [Tulasnella sp. JGI-2019a]|nr:hypothetical protein FRB94_012833 [Tulasnella sp. JGI-2019a]KAG9016398.1 hypothetical protein FRB93_010647 [Tulasnella sp. JGI-2019a]KAG9028392.1 hypothetical protein FRB95_006523 [Tulasnella sp. JGI-2019a]
MSDSTCSSPSTSSGCIIPLFAPVNGSEFVRTVRGRGYPSRSDKYILPCDEEEHQRQDIEHRVLSLVMDSLYAAPELVRRAMVPRPNVVSAVLDIGTGSGSWAMDMAREFPHADVVGLDLVPPNVSQEDIPSNCRFEVDDVNLDMSHYAKSFNIVHMRSIAMGVNNFQDLIHRLAQTLRADGAILLVGGDYRLYREDLSPSPMVQEGEPGWTASQAIFTAIHNMGKKRGGDLDAALSWTKYLNANPMYTNVGMQDIFVPLGPWMSQLDSRCTQISELVRQQMIAGFKTYGATTIEGGLKESTIERWLKMSEKEMKEMQPRIFVKWRYVWATRTRLRWETEIPEE